MNRLTDIQDLAKVAEMETKRVEDQRREQGWTPWMLYVALAALLWRLSDEIPLPHRWRDVALYWAAIVVAVDIGRTACRILSWAPRSPDRFDSPRFLPANQLLSGARVGLTFKLMVAAAANGVILWSGVLTGWLWKCWLVFFIMHLVGALATIMISFSNTMFGISRGRLSGWWLALYVMIFGFEVLAVLILASHLAENWIRVFNPADFKVGLLGFAVGEVSTLLLLSSSSADILARLYRIRRDIGMGEVSAAQAQQNLNEVIYGLPPEVILQPKVEEVFAAIAQFDQEIDVALRSSSTPQASSLGSDALLDDRTETGSASETEVKRLSAVLNAIEHSATIVEIQAIGMVNYDR
ncbi:MAG: hypothetical protein ABI222_17840, partial [Opitutaceae bacterium]